MFMLLPRSKNQACVLCYCANYSSLRKVFVVKINNVLSNTAARPPCLVLCLSAVPSSSLCSILDLVDFGVPAVSPLGRYTQLLAGSSQKRNGYMC